MSLSETIKTKFLNKVFHMQDVYEEFKDKPKTTLRGRIYDNLDIKFKRIYRNTYMVISDEDSSSCLLIEGDGRNLSFIEDNSIDAIVTDHPWNDLKSNKGGNRQFTNYECFEYTYEDFKEKARVLKDGSFLVEFIPAENESNYEYLYRIKKMAEDNGLLYYAKVTWKKGNFISNTGRKAKNTEDVLIFSKGKPRKLRIDAKRTKSKGITQYMRGTNGMLPAMFDVQSVPIRKRINASEKPIPLYEIIINFISLEGEVILDQFAGSGNCGIASIKQKRNCILIEKAKETYNNVKVRLNDYMNNEFIYI